MNEKQRTRLFVFLGFLLCICALVACKTGVVSTKIVPIIPGATYVGDQTCLDCHSDSHQDLMTAYKRSIHGSLADFETPGIRKGCESCHGLGSLHAESEKPSDILNFKQLEPKAVAEICLECHKTGSCMKWRGSEHAMNDVSCIDCHQMHKARSSVGSEKMSAPTSAWERHALRSHSLKKAEPDLCYDCHKNIQARFNYPSHHPVREGKMICSDCHEPHGGPGNLKTEGIAEQDVCFNCHARYQGPFAYEHEAVLEGCSSCHEPHGAVVDNLLKKTEPFLCLQCHRVHSPINAVGNLTQTVGNRCSYCHPEVHGSNVTPHLGLK